MEETRLIELCGVESVPPGSAIRVCVSGFAAIAVVNLDDEYYALADTCTHGAGSLSEGFLDDDVIVCPVHAGEFHIPTGKALDIPVTEDVQVFPTTVKEGRVWAELAVIGDTGRSAVDKGAEDA